jgi:hypothetical protein
VADFKTLQQRMFFFAMITASFKLMKQTRDIQIFVGMEPSSYILQLFISSSLKLNKF